jgi:hypothetical protein
MEKKNRRLIALIAASALMSARVYAQTGTDPATLSNVDPTEAQAYSTAVSQGEDSLSAFLQQFPNSVLAPSVIAALADIVGVEQAGQIALAAGVPANTVLAAVASIQQVPGAQVPTSSDAPDTAAGGAGDSDGPNRDPSDFQPYG